LGDWFCVAVKVVFIQRPIMVGQAIAYPTATPQPDMKLLPYQAPAHTDCCHKTPQASILSITTAWCIGRFYKSKKRQNLTFSPSLDQFKTNIC